MPLWCQTNIKIGIAFFYKISPLWIMIFNEVRGKQRKVVLQPLQMVRLTNGLLGGQPSHGRESSEIAMIMRIT